MTTETINVPDLGGADSVDVIEVCVAVGDLIEAEQSILVLESDKASMEIPAPKAGKVTALHVKEGDTLSEGAAILDLEVEATEAPEPVIEPTVEEDSSAQTDTPEVEEANDLIEQESTGPSPELVTVPDVGGNDAVEVIEICVLEGDELAEGDSLVVLESDKASMEIPVPFAGTVESLKVAVGDKVKTGDALAVLLTTHVASAPAKPPAKETPVVASSDQPAVTSAPVVSTPPVSNSPQTVEGNSDSEAYAGPAARKLARQLGVNLLKVNSSGPRKRVTREDVREYVQNVVAQVETGQVSAGSGIPSIPEVDFTQFGDVELVKLSKIAKITVQNMSRSWLNVPHVTQFDEADITDLEEFRKSMKLEAEKRGVKLTPLPFLLKAAAAALQEEPSFNVSLHADGEHKVQKKYVHIGVAVDTPNGLMVPVIRDVDKKSLWQLAAETGEAAEKARQGKLMPRDMQGACFTISSLGAMGGNGFTPIVNAPEVAIMGVSKSQIKPLWNGKDFVPRQMLPLSVSYDHRAVNGADCGRFFTYLVSVLSDVRRLLL